MFTFLITLRLGSREMARFRSLTEERRRDTEPVQELMTMRQGERLIFFSRFCGRDVRIQGLFGKAEPTQSDY